MFLTTEEIKELTGRTLKHLQCEVLRKNGIPFFVNASGRPVVAVSAIEGRPGSVARPAGWKPSVIGKAA